MLRPRSLLSILSTLICLVILGQSTASSQAWRISGTLEVGRIWHQTVVLHDGSILVLGGISGSKQFMDGNSLDGRSTSSCEAYDPLTDEVHTIAPMATPRAEFPAIVAPDGKVYVFGGLSGNSQTGACTSDIEAFDPTTGEWSIVGSMSTNRRRHAAVLIDDHRVLICGGCQEDRITRGESEIYDLWTNTTEITEKMPENMKEGKFALIDGGIPCYIGGRQGGPNSPRQSAVFLFDIANKKWYRAPQPAEMPGIVSGTVVGESIVICGGNIGEIPYLFSKGVFTVQSGQAEHVLDMEESRSFNNLAPIGGRTVLVSGGMRENYGTLSSTLAIDVEGKTIVIKPEHVISRAYQELIRYDHPTRGLTFYAISGLHNTRSPLSDPPHDHRGWDGDDGHNNPELTPTIEMLTVVSESQLLAATSVEDDVKGSIRVYPNPTADRISVTAKNGTSVSIIDVEGATIASGIVSNESASFDLTSAPAGAYLVIIHSENVQTARPIIKH